MKVLVVGDLHGRFDVVETAINGAKLGERYQKVVFVGDYLDSFTESSDAQIRTLLYVLEACEDGIAEGLLGNHEYSYLDDKQTCSGWNSTTQSLVDAIGHYRIFDTLKNYTYVGRYLVTHAGVSQSLLDEQNKDLDEYLTDQDFGQVGKARGGWSGCGGLRWCDFYREFKPIPGVYQIFGHSHYTYTGAFQTKSCDDSFNYNIDCLPFSAFAPAGEEPDIAYGLIVDEATGAVETYGIL